MSGSIAVSNRADWLRLAKKKWFEGKPENSKNWQEVWGSRLDKRWGQWLWSQRKSLSHTTKPGLEGPQGHGCWNSRCTTSFIGYWMPELVSLPWLPTDTGYSCHSWSQRTRFPFFGYFWTNSSRVSLWSRCNRPSVDSLTQLPSRPVMWEGPQE